MFSSSSSPNRDSLSLCLLFPAHFQIDNFNIQPLSLPRFPTWQLIKQWQSDTFRHPSWRGQNKFKPQKEQTRLFFMKEKKKWMDFLPVAKKTLDFSHLVGKNKQTIQMASRPEKKKNAQVLVCVCALSRVPLTSLNRCDLEGLSCTLPVYGVTNTSASERDFGSNAERESGWEQFHLFYTLLVIFNIRHRTEPVLLSLATLFYLHLLWGRLDRVRVPRPSIGRLE